MKQIFTLFLFAAFFSGVAIAQEGPVFTTPSPSEGSTNGPLTTDVEDINGEKSVQINSFGNEIFVNASKHSNVNGSVSVYELTGRLVYQQKLENSTLNTISSDRLGTSYYIVDVTLNGEQYRSKVFVK